MHNYEVMVGNIGCVYAGPDERQARRDFAAYQKASQRGVGRAAGEDVTLLEDGDILQQYDGNIVLTETREES